MLRHRNKNIPFSLISTCSFNYNRSTEEGLIERTRMLLLNKQMKDMVLNVECGINNNITPFYIIAYGQGLHRTVSIRDKQKTQKKREALHCRSLHG